MDDPSTQLPQVLLDLAARLAAADDLPSGVEAVAWACDGLFPFYRVSLVLPGRTASRCCVAASWARRPEEALEGYDFSLAGHPLEPVSRDGATVVRTEPLEDHPDPALARLFRGEEKAEELGVPLELPGRRGALVFASREKGAFGPGAQAWARDVGRLLALWIRPWAGPDAPLALKEQYQGLLEAALDGIAALRDGYTVYANPSFCEIFGLSRPDRVSFVDFLEADSRSAFAEGVETLRRRSRVLPRLELSARSASGRALQLDVGLRSILYQGAPAVLLQVHNATARAEREVEVLSSRQWLDSVMQTLAHDVRGPLATIAEFSESLPERLASLDPQQISETLGVISRASRSLRELVDGLLDYSALGLCEITVRDVALEPLFRAVERELEGVFRATGGRVEYGALPAAIRGRPLEIGRIFKNLLENGLKYARPGAQPVVRVTCPAEEGRHLVFCVEDNGRGIAAGQLPKVFELLRRGEGGGAGVGLAIVERIARRHGGRAWFESEPGRGSRFYVTLPGPVDPGA